MSIIGSNILAGAAGSGVSAYEIEQSLRFNNGDSAHLHRTPSSAGSQTTFTLSVWVKSSVPSSGAEYFYATHNGSRWNGILRRSGNYDFGVDESGASAPKVVTNAKLRDPSAWYHLVMAYDTTQATSTDRVKIWINGELQSINTSAGSYPNLNHGSTFNRAAKHWIGALDDTASVYYTKDFYLAEYHLLDGTAVTNAEDFGEYDDNGVWRPIEYTGGNYGTVGYYLKFDPSAANGIGHDHSGNGNNWTASGFTTSGTGTDVMSDTPTTNYATINPLETFNGRWSNAPTNGNLEISIPSDSTLKRNYAGKHASIVVPTTGKYYFEFETNQQYTRFVAVDVEYSTSVGGGDDYALTDKKSVIFSVFDGNYYYNGANNSTASGHGGNSAPSGDIYGVAIDLGNGTLRVDLNGTAGTELDISDWAGGSARVAAFVSASTASGTIKYNFGAQGFAHTPPTGFVALNTANLPAPTIKDGSEYFNTVLYTGNATARSITGVGFQPDWIWIKRRSASEWHLLSDSVRGVNAQLATNTTNQEQSRTDQITSFDTDGFSLGTDGAGYSNANTSTYVAWNWLAGNGTSSNSDGSITSTVSANPTAGFSIVSYTGNATSGATIGHGLGVAPSMVIVKNRDDNTTHWHVYHQDVGNTKYLLLSLTYAATTASNRWNNTSPSSSVVTLGDHVSVNGSSDNMIAYCFAEVEGYSKISTYTANANSDGPFIYCGFKPSLIIFKNTSTTEAWSIFDAARNDYNGPDAKMLLPSSSAVEATSSSRDIDFLSNGFKLRVASGNNPNTNSGNVYVFAAFASSPFGGSGVSPACAR